VLSLATTATGLALPLAAKRLVENLSHHRPIAPVLALMTLLVVANAGIGATGSYVLRRPAESVVLAASRRLANSVLARANPQPAVDMQSSRGEHSGVRN
jgi:hypothetical protein